MFRTALLSIPLFVLFVATAHACRCRPPAPPLEALKKSKAAFVGKVTAVKVDGRQKVVSVAVSQSWKGDVAKEITVHTAGSSAACGYGFQVGKEYLIYCSGKSGDVWTTNLCTRTRPLGKAKEDLEALGPGMMPK